MHKEEIELFLKRARIILDGAKGIFQKEDWDLTCFMAEQSVQRLLILLLDFSLLFVS